MREIFEGWGCTRKTRRVGGASVREISEGGSERDEGEGGVSVTSLRGRHGLSLGKWFTEFFSVNRFPKVYTIFSGQTEKIFS